MPTFFLAGIQRLLQQRAQSLAEDVEGSGFCEANVQGNGVGDKDGFGKIAM
jgi:hypothetical protein